MRILKRSVTTFAAALALLAAIGIVVLGRPVSGPTPFPSDRPIARTTPSATSQEPPASDPPPSPEAQVLEAQVLPALEPAEPARQPAGECVSHMTIIDYAFEQTVPVLTRDAASVVLGRVSAIGPGRWNTASSGPSRDLEDEITPVIRLVLLDIERTVTGPDVPGPVVVWVPGGTIGCQMWSQTGDPGPLAPGERFAVFLGWRQPAVRMDNLRSTSGWFPIDAAGHIQADGRDLTVDAFIELVRHGR